MRCYKNEIKKKKLLTYSKNQKPEFLKSHDKLFTWITDISWKGSKHKFNPLSANCTKWSNTLKQFVGKLPTNCLSLFDHFVKLALKGLTSFKYFSNHTYLKHKTNSWTAERKLKLKANLNRSCYLKQMNRNFLRSLGKAQVKKYIWNTVSYFFHLLPT